MNPIKKPVFTPEELGTNPFLNSLSIPVNKYIVNGTYVRDEEGILINKELFMDYYVPVRMYCASKFQRIQLSELSDKALRLLLWILCELEVTQDYIWINKKRYMDENKIKSINTYKGAIAELALRGYITPHTIKDLFWINPVHFFRGNRVNKYPQKLHVRTKE